MVIKSPLLIGLKRATTLQWAHT